MNLTDKQWEWMRWFVIVALVAVFGFFDLNAPIQVPPTPAPASAPIAQPTASRTTNFTNLNVTGELDAATLDAATFKVGGYTQSGAMRFGTSATYTTGVGITHGFAVTPTMCIFSPLPITATLTITTTGFSANLTSENPIYWACGK